MYKRPFCRAGSSLGLGGVTGISEGDLCVVEWQVSAVFRCCNPLGILLNPVASSLLK